jgi:hypothetical protein
VNFKNLVHKGEMIINEQYVLTSQVDQVFYIEDQRGQDWACTIRTKPRNLYNIGQGEGLHDACANYHKCKPLILTNSDDYNPQDDVEYVQSNLDPI